MSKNWYIDNQEFLQHIFGDDADLIAALLAATSPQMSVAASWTVAVKVYHQYKAGKNIDFTKFRSCHKSNIARALSGEPLSGNKVRAFYQNLIGNLQAVTIDTWMLRLFKWFDRGTVRIPTNRQYEKLAKCFAKLANQNGYEPAEFQAILWSHYRGKQGYKPTSYSKVGIDKRQLLFNFTELEPEPAPF